MTKVKCPNCQFANPAGRETCVRCSTPLPRIEIQALRQADGPSPVEGVVRDIQLRKGQIIANRYTALDIVGRGGMGCIYRVRDNTLNEEVALKMLLPQFVQDKVVVDRFINEARIARQLSHPNIVRVHDIGVAGSVLYISMEFLKGLSLRGLLDDLPPGQRLPIRQTLDIMDQLCAALEYAHQFTVHRDIKPENVMVQEDGSIKLMDFGISKLMSNMQLTSASMVMGTPYYMSPEQLKDSRSVDARADIYSLGVMLYEILTGNLPTGVPKAASQLVRDIPPELDVIVETCVDPDPNGRYPTVAELRNALRPIKALADSGTLMVAAKGAAKTARTGGAAVRKLAAGVLAALILALCGLGIWRLESRMTSAAPVEGPSAPASAKSVEDQFKALSARVEIAQAKALVKAKESAAFAKIVELAKTKWELAQQEAARGDARALVDGRHALQCFLAPIIQPEDMVFIPPGEVTMSDSSGSGPVQLDGFFMDKKEVTNRQFLDFAQQVEKGWRVPPYLQNPSAELENLPVALVTFYDALAYAAWIGKSLPTEAQWAMAAYGAKDASDKFPWGETWDAAATNAGGGEDGYPGLSPAGSYSKEGQDVTRSGCYDMAGNVSEWTRSEFRSFPYAPYDGREDQTVFGFETQLAVRGGNFRTQGTELFRRGNFPYDTANDALGFRCVQELPSGSDLSEVDALLRN